MARQIIDIGTQGNDGTGDSIRESFRKVNDNFTQIFAIFGSGDRISFRDLDDTPANFPNGIARDEVGSDADKLIVSNEFADALVAKNLVGGTGIFIDHSDENEIVVVSTGGSLVTDDEPSLGGHLNGREIYAIGNILDPSAEAKNFFNSLHDTNIQEDDLVMSRGYADRRYVQSGGLTGVGGRIRVRSEPDSVLEYFLTVDWDDQGYAVINNHGFNTAINGTAFVYINSGNEPATGIINETTYYLRYYDSNRLAVYASKDQSLDEDNFGSTRIIVNIDPTIFKTIYNADLSTISGSGLPTLFNFENIPVSTVTGIGSGARIDIVKNNTDILYSSDNIIITFTDEGEDYAAGDELKILGTDLGGTSPANDLMFSLPDQFRGNESLVDAAYDPELSGNWISDEVLPRKSVVRRQGDSMEGALILHDHPGSLAGLGTPFGSDDLQAATKLYVDSSSYASQTNLFVSNSGNDDQPNTPEDKQGRAFSYAYATVGKACERAEELIKQSLTEPGPYRQPITYDDNAYKSYVSSFTTGTGVNRTLKIFTDGQGVDQSKFINNRDLREGSVIKGLKSGATGKVIKYEGIIETDDVYQIELLHTTKDITYFETGFFNAASRLDNNLDFIKDEVIRYIDSKPSTTSYNEEKCARDVGYIVEAIKNDISFGGNSNTVKAAKAYRRGAAFALPTEQIAQTLDGIAYIKLLMIPILENSLIAAPTSISGFGKRGTIDQDVSGSEAESDVYDLIETLFNTLLDIIDTGTSTPGEPLEFIEGELLEYGQPVPELQITIRIESGVYYEQLPIRIPANVSLKGDEFRRCIIRPAAGQSLSPWSAIYFYRDTDFDGLSRTYSSNTAAASTAQATTSSASGTGAIVTLSFATQPSIPFPDGTIIEVSGMTPSAYNGTHRVITGTDSSITFSSTETAPQTVAGTIKGTVVTLATGDVNDMSVGMYLRVMSGTGRFQTLTRVTRFIGTTAFEIDKAPITTLVSAEVRGLNASGLAPTGSNFGYHYLTDPTGLSGIFDDTVAKPGGSVASSNLLKTNATIIGNQVVAYIESTYPDLDYNSSTCARDVRYIVEAIADDLVNGGFERSLAAGYSYKRNASSRIAITTQLTETLDGIGRINTIAQALLAGSPTEAVIVADLIQGIQNIIIGVNNPPKDNKDMDVFLMNDGTIIRNITCQGHGGFMCVLDPEGQIQTKSPYVQTATSLSGSINQQAFRGGMFIDGFAGNLPARIVSATSPTELVLGGLSVRDIQVPNSFYIGGLRYQINVSSYDAATATSAIILDDATPFRDYLGVDIIPDATDIVAGSDIVSGQFVINLPSTAGLVVGMRLVKTAGVGTVGAGAKIESMDSTSITLDKAHTASGSLTFSIDGINAMIETPGNRSMLANDYTQVNDLGYGVICTNNGIAELVSVFTYYNWTSYYSLNGSQIRSVAGNSSNGKYGMRAAGRDPNEVPDPVALADNTIQAAKIYKRGSFAARNLAGELSIYIDYYDHTPNSVSEIEIDHTNTRSEMIVNTNSNPNNVTIVSGGGGYVKEEFIDVDGGTLFTGGSKTRIRVTEIDNTPGKLTGAPGVITKFEVIEPGSYSINPFGGYPTITGTVSTTSATGVGAGATFSGTYLGDIIRYEVSNVESTTSIGEGVNPGGVVGTRNVLKLNLDASTGLQAPLADGQIVTLRGLQNFKFTGIQVIRPTRPSTALEFTAATEVGQVYRTLAYTRSSPIDGNLLVQKVITNIARDNNTATITLSTPHTLVAGSIIDQIICGTDDTFEGTSIIVLDTPDANSFTYNSPGDDVDPAVAAVGVVSYGDTAILTFDTSYNYAIIQTNETKLADTDYVDGGGKTMGATVGDTRIAVETIESATTKNRLNSNKLLLGWGGKVFKITEYVDSSGSNSAYITLEDLPYGEGSIVNVAGISHAIPTVQPTVLRAGIEAEAAAEITVNISTCRATGHDFLDIGTGGFNSTNYPSNVFGAPSQPPEPSQEVREETQGRVFYVSTDQDGVFRVGRFFSVDQGTGTVTFAASIALSNLDGIGFKRGTVVKEFSTDVTMTDNADDTVPTESAVRGYIDRRLGLTHTGGVVIDSQRIPIGSGFLDLGGTLSMAGDLNMGGGDPPTPHRIINLAAPSSSTDAATKGYIDNLIAQNDTFAELKDVGVISTNEGQLPVFSGAGPAIISSSVGGVLSSSVESTVTASLVGGITILPTIDSGIIGTGQSSISGGIVVNNVAGFPSNGHLRIGNEIFSYSSITSIANRFDNVVRSKFNTAGSIHSTGATVESLDNSFINFQIVDGSIVNADVSSTAGIIQSKLNMSLATAAATAPIGTTAQKQAASGLSSFDSANFAVTDGWVGIKAGGVSLSEIQNIDANSVIGNLSSSAAVPSEVQIDDLVLSGVNQLFIDFEDGATVLSRRENSLKLDSSLTIVSGTPVAGDGVIQVAVSSITGTGYGAVVKVSYTDTPLVEDGPTVPRYTGIEVVNGGNGYAEGNTLIVYGTQLGGASPANDITFTIDTTGNNIDQTVRVGVQKTSITADANAIVKTDIDSNLGTGGTRFGKIFANIFDGALNGNADTATTALTAATAGTVTTAAQPNITSVGTLTSLEISGLVKYSVEDNITAAGTNQGSAFALSKNFNIVTTSAIPSIGNPAPGVLLPNTAPIGNRIIIRNDTFNNVIVYPNSGYQIGTLGTNVGFILNGETALEFVCVRAPAGGNPGQWYTLNATFA
jgi:hypothetical protein